MLTAFELANNAIDLAGAGAERTNMHLSLYDPNLTLLAETADAGAEPGGESARMAVDLADPGTYFLYVNGCCPGADSGGVGAYELAVVQEEQAHGYDLVPASCTSLFTDITAYAC